MAPAQPILDVVIIGAGISGIGTAYWLQKKCPGRTFTILEARDRIGGTWSLFQYPGIRSDSDMYTFGYRFKPWRNPQALSKGEDILAYLDEAVEENDLRKRIQFGCQVQEAHWSDDAKTWRLKVLKADVVTEVECRFLSVCSGYYSYTEAHRPAFEGEEDFRGEVIHPQFWPQGHAYQGKRVVVVGSGATAVTLVPAMAENGAAHVTMLQRTPSYIFSIPNRNRFFHLLQKTLPASWAYALIRFLTLALGSFFYGMTRRFPKAMKSYLVKKVAQQLPPGFDVEKHFSPQYNPWDQRLCAVPDGDLFKSIRSGKVSVATDEISRFTAQGILLKSGQELPADLVVLATGLKISLMGKARFFVNGAELDLSRHQIYKGMMLSNVPNLVYAFGYANASWTLKVDLTANYLCKLLRHMERSGHSTVTPIPAEAPTAAPFVPLRAGYVLRAAHTLPKQGRRQPWRVYQNYFRDMWMIRYGRLRDGVLRWG